MEMSNRPIFRVRLTSREHQLVDALFYIGPTLPGGMGEIPLTWAEIYAWATMTRSVLSPKEAEIVFEMSRAYLTGRENGSDVVNNRQPIDRTEDPMIDLEEEDILRG